MADLPLSPQLFAILSALIEERLGIHYDPPDRDLLAEKIAPRARELGFDSLLDYYYFLRYDEEGPGEVEALLELLVVQESYFFREVEPLEVLVDQELLPRVGPGRRPRVWSAACASGEEPLSLAMLLDAREALDRVELIASDLSPRSLQAARTGVFSPRALRTPAARARALRWVEEREGKVVAPRRLIDAIDWRRVNLIAPDEVEALGRFDAILCRNVLIYFSDATAAAVVRRLAGALRPGGVLLVGVSESLHRLGAPLVCEERGGSFLYRRPAAGAPARESSGGTP